MNPLLPWHETMAIVLLHFLWQACAVAVLAEMTIRMLRVKRGAPQYSVYLAAFLALAVCPMLTLVYLCGAVDTLGANSTAISFSGATTPDWTIEIASTVRPYSVWIVATWFVGFAAFGFRVTCGMWALYRVRARMLDVSDEWFDRAQLIAQRLGVRSRWTVKASEAVREPMTFGWLRPVIVVPLSFFSTQPPEILDAVLAHELAHIRRYDLWVNAFQRLVESVLFFHPIVWWISRRIREERELCCDDMAVGLTGQPVAYATALERVASIRLASRVAPLAVAMGAPVLGYRVRRVLGLADPAATAFATPRLVAVAAFGVLLVALSTGRTDWVGDRVVVASPESGDAVVAADPSVAFLRHTERQPQEQKPIAATLPDDRSTARRSDAAPSISDATSAEHSRDSDGPARTRSVATPEHKPTLKVFDLNRDGQLDEDERKAIEEAYASRMKERSRAMLAKHDSNKDGKLDFREKAIAWTKYRKSKRSRHYSHDRTKSSDEKSSDKRRSRENISHGKRHEDWRKQVIAKYDSDENGKLDDEERSALHSAWKVRREQYWKSFVERYDVDGNGRLDEHERMAVHLTRVRATKSHRSNPGST